MIINKHNFLKRSILLVLVFSLSFLLLGCSKDEIGHEMSDFRYDYAQVDENLITINYKFKIKNLWKEKITGINYYLIFYMNNKVIAQSHTITVECNPLKKGKVIEITKVLNVSNYEFNNCDLVIESIDRDS